MSGRILIRAIEIAIAAQFVAAAVAHGADYRGAASGWPAYNNGYYAANYPTNYGGGAAYYVARPVTTAGYAPAPGTVTYVPARVAYANPTYYAAYGRSPVMYRPVSAAGYAPTAAYYAPTTANYAPGNAYAVQPAGMGSAGSEAAAYYGQPTAVNYVAPQYNYRTNYAPVPVYMYRPVTAYDPITAQPQTCMQASTCNTCQPQRSRCFSLLNPFSWFGSSSCGSSGCGYSGCGQQPSCTTNYCGQAYQQSSCGQQPYYPAQPMTPVVPVYPSQPPMNVIPALPRGSVPYGGSTIPSPPTVAPGSRTTIVPADAAPNLGPRTFTPVPGSTIPTQPMNPGFNPAPGGSFQTAPVQPGMPGGTGSFGTGANYPPAADPYSAPLTPVEKAGTTPSNSAAPSGTGTVFGSGFRSGEAGEPNVIRQPGSSRPLPPSVRTVPDLDSPNSPRPINAAPKLIDPQDKTARLGNRWAAVPAKWPEQAERGASKLTVPTQSVGTRELRDRPVTQMRAYEPQNVSLPMNSPYKNVQQQPANAAKYDDGGWKTAAGY